MQTCEVNAWSGANLRRQRINAYKDHYVLYVYVWDPTAVSTGMCTRLGVSLSVISL